MRMKQWDVIECFLKISPAVARHKTVPPISGTSLSSFSFVVSSKLPTIQNRILNNKLLLSRCSADFQVLVFSGLLPPLFQSLCSSYFHDDLNSFFCSFSRRQNLKKLQIPWVLVAKSASSSCCPVLKILMRLMFRFVQPFGHVVPQRFKESGSTKFEKKKQLLFKRCEGLV